VIDYSAYKARRSFKNSRVSFLEDVSEILTSGTGGLQEKLLSLANRNSGKAIERVYRHVYSVINQGGDISAALKPYFPVKEYSMIAAYDAGAENDADRGKGLLAVSQILGPIQELKTSGFKLLARTIFAAALVLLMWVGVAGGFAKDMSQLAPRATWNPFSTVVIGSGEWLAGHYITSSIFVCLILFALIWAFPNWRGERRAWADRHLPGFGIYREFRSALTLISLASYIKSRQGLGASFKQVSETANSWEIWYLEKMRENSTRLAGSAMLDVGFFDARIIDRLVMRDEVMPLEQSLEQVGLEQAQKVVDSMRMRLELAGKVADGTAKAFAGAVVIAVLLINLSAMSNLSGLR
jgi:hypothetical protein